MRGPELAKKYVTDYLEDMLPSYLLDLRIQWGRDTETLPDPVAYFPHEPRALDRWPMIATSAVRMSRVAAKEQTRLGATYGMTYGLRTFIWVKMRGFEESIQVRDDLTTAVRIALLDVPWLGLNEQQALVEETTLTEEYSDVTAVKGDRFVAGSYLGFDLHVEEGLERAARGTVASTMVEVVPLPPLHPALDD